MIKVIKITQPAQKRWIRPTCPECKHKITVGVKLGVKREIEACCPECDTKFVITWDTTDEMVH